MKKIPFLSLIAGLFFLTSCDVTREIVINENGTGTFTNTLDMSGMIGLAKMSGNKDMEELNDKQMDTTFSLEKMVDSLEGLDASEKQLAKKGTMNFVMNLQDEKFLTKMNFPFTNIAEVGKLDKISSKAMKEGVKKQMAGNKEEGKPSEEDNIPSGSVDDYYITTYNKGVIERKLDTAKYAKLDEDKGMQGLKEMMGQGMPITSKTIITLPKAAKKAEGKNVKLSDDKKKVTIDDSMESFFDDGKTLEYRIEY